MTIIRLYRSRYSPKDATGAKLHGGRWNSPGYAVLYASSTLALACLEVLVHVRDIGLVPTDYTFCEVKVPDALISPWVLRGEEALGKIESPVLSQEFGDAWIASTTFNPDHVQNWLAEYRRLHPELSEDVTHMITQSIRERRAPPVQAVPSVIVPREMNYLLSPEHPQFEELTWGEPEPFQFDPRLIGSSVE
jgi:RES domain-containing protein